MTAASVWFSAANLAVQLRKDQALVNAVIESRRETRDASQQVSSAVPSGAVAAASDRLTATANGVENRNPA
jgi:hypothetical protein